MVEFSIKLINLQGRVLVRNYYFEKGKIWLVWLMKDEHVLRLEIMFMNHRYRTIFLSLQKVLQLIINLGTIWMHGVVAFDRNISFPEGLREAAFDDLHSIYMTSLSVCFCFRTSEWIEIGNLCGWLVFNKEIYYKIIHVFTHF